METFKDRFKRGMKVFLIGVPVATLFILYTALIMSYLNNWEPVKFNYNSLGEGMLELIVVGIICIVWVGIIIYYTLKYIHDTSKHRKVFRKIRALRSKRN